MARRIKREERPNRTTLMLYSQLFHFEKAEAFTVSANGNLTETKLKSSLLRAYLP
jgi:hypothetical protein